MVNRITSGRITIDGRPAQSLHVKLFDRDSIELGPFNLNYRTTYLGEAHTNNDGFYSISYGPDSYGGGLDEDTIETKAAELPSLQNPFRVAAEYGPGNPDLLIEVYRGNTLLKTSEVADVSDEEFTLDVNIESGTPPERNAFEAVGDTIADGAVVVASGIQFVISTVATATATIVGVIPVVGPTVSGFISEIGRRIGEGIQFVGLWLQYTWETRTDRVVSVPDDLWDLCAQRFQTLKREVLLRHFLPPWNADARYIPYYVTEYGLLGFRDRTKQRALKCHPTDRYGFTVKPEVDQTGVNRFVIEGERADYDARKTRTEKDTTEAAGLSWAEFRRHLPTYARTYENGLVYTASFIAAIAYEHAVLPPNIDPQERVDCQNIIALALDTLEELETRAGLSGYLIRYDERGDGIELFHDRTFPCGFLQTRMPPVTNYCTPVGSRPVTAEAFDLELRFRRHEPSGDEYVALIEGLAVAYNVLPSSAAVRDRVRSMLARIHRYLEEHYYYLMRPCGNFVARGCSTAWYEYPWSSFFECVLGVPSREARIDSREVFDKAGLGSPDLLVECPVEDLPPELPRPRLLVPSNLNTDEICEIIGAEVVRSNEEISKNNRYELYSEAGNVAGVPYWTLFMLAKSALLGKWCPDANLELKEAFRKWFHLVDIEHSGGKSPENHSWNPTSMATAVALNAGSSILWHRWRNFFADESVYPFDRLPCEYHQITNDAPKRHDPHDKVDVAALLENSEQVLIAERGEAAAANVLWPIATVAHTLAKSLFIDPTVERPETASLGTMKVPAPAPAYGKTLPGITVRDLVNEEIKKRESRLNTVANRSRPLFITDPALPGLTSDDLKSTQLFTTLTATRGADKVFIVPAGESSKTEDRARHLGAFIASKMNELRARRELPDLSFDLIGYSIGGVVARMLLLMIPSVLQIYWPNNFVLLGTPNRGSKLPPPTLPDLNEAASTISQRRHHHDVRIYTCVGLVAGLEGDGFVSTDDARLSPDEAATIVEQKAINNVVHAPAPFLFSALGALGLPWYFVETTTIQTVFTWVEQPTMNIRYPY